RKRMRWSPRGCRAPKGAALPTCCLAITTSAASCRAPGPVRWARFRSISATRITIRCSSTAMDYVIRKASLADRSDIQRLIAESARGLSREHYDDAQIETAIATVFGVDT